MEDKKKEIIRCLFETNAVRICTREKPFWYASGLFGPYYVNTHFLYGSENKAVKLLSFIDENKGNKLEFPQFILTKTCNNYLENKIYKNVIDELYMQILMNFDSRKIDFVSGGERRDWFFSNIIAHIMDKPHLTIYKNHEIVITENGKDEYAAVDLKNACILHVADLVTKASSYVDNWIPALKKVNGNIEYSITVIDRDQGGNKILSDNNIHAMSLAVINKELFKTALDEDIIDTEQYNMIADYIKSPDDFMMNYIKENPDFLNNALNADIKTKKRAEKFKKLKNI